MRSLRSVAAGFTAGSEVELKWRGHPAGRSAFEFDQDQSPDGVAGAANDSRLVTATWYAAYELIGEGATALASTDEP